MRAVVVGATGLVGGHVVQELIDSPRYEGVVLLTRRDSGRRHPKLQEYQVDLLRPETFPKEIAVDQVFCCLGTTMKHAQSKQAFLEVDLSMPLTVARWAREQGAHTFVLNSSVGADVKALSFYLRTKGQLEKELAELDLPYLAVVRPSFLIGKRQKHRIGEGLAIGALRPLAGLLPARLKRYCPVLARDVAKTMVALAQESSSAPCCEIATFRHSVTP